MTWYQNHRARILAKARSRYKTDPGFARRCRVRTRKYWRLNKVKISAARKNPTYRLAARKAFYKSRYRGFTLEDKAALLRKQKGKCAICTRQTPDTKQGWHTDHDHKTHRVRGILCRRCNHRLGVVEDKKFLRAAMNYLLPRR
jgi:5-methylcytosine-specific restriction endonuclease McrA